MGCRLGCSGVALRILLHDHARADGMACVVYGGPRAGAAGVLRAALCGRAEGLSGVEGEARGSGRETIAAGDFPRAAVESHADWQSARHWRTGRLLRCYNLAAHLSAD